MKHSILLLSFLVCISPALAADNPERARVAAVLRGEKAAERPAAVVELLKKAKPKELASVTELVVRTAVSLNPATAAVLAGTVARAVPQVGGMAAAAAAAEQPSQAPAIARAAAKANPAAAAGIVAAVCRAAPAQYRAVAVAVSAAFPGKRRDILLAVAEAIPELRPGIEHTLGEKTDVAGTVGMVLDEVARGQGDPPTANGPQPLAPRVGPPFIPLSGTVRTVTPDTSDEVPTGGRNYARP